MGIKEDGVNEVGRPTIPPIVADGIAGSETADSGADNDAVGDAGTADDSRVPFPADEVGKPKPRSQYDLGFRSGLEPSSSSQSPDADSSGASEADGDEFGDGETGAGGDGGSPVTDDALPADMVAQAGKKTLADYADGASAGMALTGAAAALGSKLDIGGKLDSGRQAVKNAVTATNSWLASRTAKSDSSADAPGTESAAAYSQASDSPVAGGPAAPEETRVDMAPVGPAPAGDGRSLWRDTYTPPQGASRPPSPWSSQPSGGIPGGGAPSDPAHGSPAHRSPAHRSSSQGSEGWAAGGPAGMARSAASAAGAGLAGYAGSVTTAWQQNRNTGPNRKHDAARRNKRQAHLTLARVEPWSVMKFSFISSLVAFIILFVAIAVLYEALSALGVFTSLQHTVSSITSSQGSSGTNISTWFSASRILGYTGMLGALNIILITALSTIGAVIYNLIAHAFGGIEVTLRETE